MFLVDERQTNKKVNPIYLITKQLAKEETTIACFYPFKRKRVTENPKEKLRKRTPTGL